MNDTDLFTLAFKLEREGCTPGSDVYPVKLGDKTFDELLAKQYARRLPFTRTADGIQLTQAGVEFIEEECNIPAKW